jgi:photosystem II stability/assembly factor-like uncharacterized protein
MRRMSLRTVSLALIMALAAIAQEQRTETVSKKALQDQQDAQKKADDQGKLLPDNKPKKPEDKWFSGMKFRNIGPFRGGRSLTVSGIEHNPNVYYFGGVGGGIWKTTDGAMTWSSVFDKEGTSSIGSLAVSQSDPNIVYAGTGETAMRGNISHGDGIYKTIDGGKTWKNLGLKDSRAIGKVIIHPTNPDIVFVAAFGHQYGPNTERGVFRTLDGGKSWTRVLYKDDKTGAVDISFDPHNPNILFATLWQAYRTPWSLESGGPGSGLYRSSDGGSTWKHLDEGGLPKGPWGKAGVVVAANSERIYALIEAADGGLYRSDDGGEKWELVNSNRALWQRAWYYMHVVADPRNADVLYIMDVEFFKSTDGGRSFNKIKVPHGDNHALWIDPENTQRMIQGDDGGATVTLDGGHHWTQPYNQPTAQFYHVTTDNRFPYYVYGAQQDNSTVAIASRSDAGPIDRPDWYPVGGGEAGYISPYLPDPNIVYAGDYEGVLTRFDKRTGQVQNIAPWPEISDGQGAANLVHRFQWTAPNMLSIHDPHTLYHAGEMLFKTTDEGMHWTAISPDLTRNDKSKQQISGGPIDKDDTGTEYYDTIFALAESKLEKDLIWAGTDDGLIQITRDAGKTWTNVTPKNMPEWSRVSLIEASPHQASVAYAAIDRHQNDDLAPYIYKTADYGKTWVKITNGIPANTFVRAVREDPKRRGLLFAGTETGIFYSMNDGANWLPLKLNLPTTPVHDLVIKDDDLVVATHGRSFWILDDITPLRQFQDAYTKEALHLYTPQTAVRLHGPADPPKSPLAGQNPPAGAIIDYWLRAKPKSELRIEVMDAAGKVIRRYSSKKLKERDAPPDPDDEKPKFEIEPEEGLNRFVWDLHTQNIVTVPNYYLYEEQGGVRGPMVVPGSYQVRITADGKATTANFDVKLDPRVTVSPADLQKQFDFVTGVQQQLDHVYRTVDQMLALRAGIKAVNQRLPDNTQAKHLAELGVQLDQKIAIIQDALIDFKIQANEDSLAYALGLDGKLAALAATVEGEADAAPTQSEYQVLAKYNEQLTAQMNKWQSLVSTDLTAIQKLAAEQNISAIGVR